MKDKRVLIVSSEVVPYLPENELSTTSFETAKMIHSNGGQTRIFMPRYGLINERRHQLHEVIRLSGMNLVINDMDMPLIIKVASIPKERMQVYFIAVSFPQLKMPTTPYVLFSTRPVVLTKQIN